MNDRQNNIVQTMGKLFLQQEIVANLTVAEEDSALCDPGRSCLILSGWPFTKTGAR